MPLTFLRHTRPAIADGICYGQLDINVADSFDDEVAAILTALPIIPRFIVTSPLLRCRRLANAIGARLDVDLHEDAGLMEMDFGRWEGVAWDAIPRQDLDAWAADFADANPHGGETVARFKHRVDEALTPYRTACENALVVCHAGVIRAALACDLTPHAFSTAIAFGQFVDDQPRMLGD